jgi:hypothetical protein
MNLGILIFCGILHVEATSYRRRVGQFFFYSMWGKPQTRSKELKALLIKNTCASSTAKNNMRNTRTVWTDKTDTKSFPNCCFLFHITYLVLGFWNGCFQSPHALGPGLDQVDGTKQTLVGKWVGWMDVWKVLRGHEFCNINHNVPYRFCRFSLSRFHAFILSQPNITLYLTNLYIKTIR